MTLTLDLKTSFKVTAHTLIVSTLWVKYDPDWTKGRKDMPWTRFFHTILLWLSHLTLKLGSMSLYTLFSKALFVWSVSKIGLSGEYICSEKIIFAQSKKTSTLDLQTSFKVNAQLWSISTVWVKFEPNRTKEREKMLWTRIFHIILLWPSASTEKHVSRSLHILYLKALCVKYKPDLAKRREDILQTRDLGWTNGQKDGWTEGQMDGQTDH